MLSFKINIYGLVQESRNWFLRLSKIYEHCGFKQSKLDPRLFLIHDLIIALCTDECLIYAPNTSEIETFVKILCEEYKLTLNNPYQIDDFLGIHFSHKDNGENHMSQTGLIDVVTDSAIIPIGQLKTHPHQQP
jgi:hypothetical protein